jgi:hypothetical protein
MVKGVLNQWMLYLLSRLSTKGIAISSFSMYMLRSFVTADIKILSLQILELATKSATHFSKIHSVVSSLLSVEYCEHELLSHIASILGSVAVFLPCLHSILSIASSFPAFLSLFESTVCHSAFQKIRRPPKNPTVGANTTTP